MQKKPKKLPNSNKKVAIMRKRRKLDEQKRRFFLLNAKKKFIHSFANEKMWARSNLFINSRISPSGEHFAYEEKVVMQPVNLFDYNNSSRDLDNSLNCPPAGGWQPCWGLPVTGAGVCLDLNARYRTLQAEYLWIVNCSIKTNETT